MWCGWHGKCLRGAECRHQCHGYRSFQQRGMGAGHADTVQLCAAGTGGIGASFTAGSGWDLSTMSWCPFMERTERNRYYEGSWLALKYSDDVFDGAWDLSVLWRYRGRLVFNFAVSILINQNRSFWKNMMTLSYIPPWLAFLSFGLLPFLWGDGGFFLPFRAMRLSLLRQ